MVYLHFYAESKLIQYFPPKMINSRGSDTRPKKVYYPLDKLRILHTYILYISEFTL